MWLPTFYIYLYTQCKEREIFLNISIRKQKKLIWLNEVLRDNVLVG